MSTHSAPNVRFGSPLIANARARRAAWSRRRSATRGSADLVDDHARAVAAAPLLRPAHRQDPASHRWQRYVALGDSFSEGMNDVLADGSLRGWADQHPDGAGVLARLAVRLTPLCRQQPAGGGARLQCEALMRSGA